MGRLNDLLNECGEFFIATVDGNQPKLRPIGAHTEEDGMVRFYIGGHKDVFRQLTENPLCEIARMVKKGPMGSDHGEGRVRPGTGLCRQISGGSQPGAEEHLQ